MNRDVCFVDPTSVEAEKITAIQITTGKNIFNLAIKAAEPSRCPRLNQVRIWGRSKLEGQPFG